LSKLTEGEENYKYKVLSDSDDLQLLRISAKKYLSILKYYGAEDSAINRGIQV
jgi:hypothetical protein